jgi:hypothetical protein
MDHERRNEIMKIIQNKSELQVYLASTKETQQWALEWKRDELVNLTAGGLTFVPDERDLARCLFVSPHPSEQGKQMRIELYLTNPLSGDLRKNTEPWFYDNWHLVSLFHEVSNQQAPVPNKKYWTAADRDEVANTFNYTLSNIYSLDNKITKLVSEFNGLLSTLSIPNIEAHEPISKTHPTIVQIEKAQQILILTYPVATRIEALTALLAGLNLLCKHLKQVIDVIRSSLQMVQLSVESQKTLIAHLQKEVAQVEADAIQLIKQNSELDEKMQLLRDRITVS